MVNLFGKESHVEKVGQQHVELVLECVKKLKDIMACFYQNNFDKLDEEVEELSKLEHKADVIRRQMEIEYYHGTFLPFDREDRIVLAELVDNVADMAKDAVYRISLSRIHFPSKGQKVLKNSWI